MCSFSVSLYTKCIERLQEMSIPVPSASSEDSEETAQIICAVSSEFSLRIQMAVGGPDTPLKNHKNIGFLSNTSPDPLKHHKAIKPAFSAGPSSARQRNTI